MSYGESEITIEANMTGWVVFDGDSGIMSSNTPKFQANTIEEVTKIVADLMKNKMVKIAAWPNVGTHAGEVVLGPPGHPATYQNAMLLRELQNSGDYEPTFREYIEPGIFGEAPRQARQYDASAIMEAYRLRRFSWSDIPSVVKDAFDSDLTQTDTDE